MLSTADRIGCINSYDKRGSVVFRVVKALGSARVQMNTLFPGTEAKKAVLYDVLYVPKLTCSLFSVLAAVAKGYAVGFGSNNWCIWDENGKRRRKGVTGS